MAARFAAWAPTNSAETPESRAAIRGYALLLAGRAREARYVLDSLAPTGFMPSHAPAAAGVGGGEDGPP